MKKSFTACAAWGILPALLLLTGCTSGSSAASASLAASMLYQPPVLRLPAGQPVQTRDGIHKPQVDEVWHSDARYRTLEQENLDLAAALRAKSK